MALIKCPECGKEISDKVPKCIHCGYPISGQQTPPPNNYQNPTGTKKSLSTLIYIIPAALVLIIAVVVLAIPKDQREIDADYRNQIIGVWNYDQKLISSDYIGQLGVDKSETNNSFYANAKGYIYFKNDNTYLDTYYYLISLKKDGVKKSITVSREEKGKWEIRDGFLFQTRSHSSYLPVDIWTQSILETKPNLFSDLLKDDSKTHKSKIVDLDNKVMVIEASAEDFKKEYSFAKSYNTVPPKRKGKLRVKLNGYWCSYEGGIENNLPDGNGKADWDNGNHYVGDFKSGQLNGTGKFSRWNGDFYKGSFLNGYFNGKGYLSYAKGGYVNANWKSGKLEGQGNAKYSSGDSYSGNYKNGLRHGYGVYTWKNGNYYRGDWKNDKQDGYGTMYNAAGKIIDSGYWHNGIH